MKNEELSPEQMQQILNETESESDLTGSEEEKETQAISFDNNNVFQFVECWFVKYQITKIK